MQNRQGDINVKLQSQSIAQANEITHLRGLLADSVPLDEHLAVADELTASETRNALLLEENEGLRKRNEEIERQLAESLKKSEDMQRRLKDMDDLKKMLEQKNCDAQSVVKLLSGLIFGRSSEKSGFNDMLADGVDILMDIHDADLFVSQLAGFASSAMAMASPEELASATDSPKKTAKGGRPSRRKKDGTGGKTTSDRPAQIVDGCPYSPSFAAYYLTMKFAYNLSEKKIIRMLGETAFRAFLRNGYIELENNAIERLFRHLATGRRNWTHSGSHDAAKNIAFMYSLYESVVMNDVSFGSYIEEVLERIMAGDTNYRDMLPNRIVLSKDRLEAA